MASRSHRSGTQLGDDGKCPLPFRIPPHVGGDVDLYTERHEEWRIMVENARRLVVEDLDIQKRVARGLRIRTRSLPMDMLSRTYIKYIDFINKIYSAYTRSYQLQRAEYMQEIVNLLVKRIFELRNEMSHYIVNEYVYVDGPLQQLQMTPYDIEIVVPYHVPLEARSDSMETMLQRMWFRAKSKGTDKVKRKKEKKPPSPPPLSMEDDNNMFGSGIVPPPAPEPTAKGEGGEEEEDEESEEEFDPLAYHIHEPEPDWITIYVTLLQRHERYRQFYLKWYLAKAKKLRQQRRIEKKSEVQFTDEQKARSVKLIQDFHREFMRIKRLRLIEHERDIFLGLLPDEEARPLDHITEERLANERHYKKKQLIKKYYKQAQEKEEKRLLLFRKGELIEDITEDVLQWFMEWYHGYGFFPNYPYELEGGTVIVVNGKYPTIEEQLEDDEMYAKLTKGKTKEQLKKDREKAAEQERLAAEAEKDRLKKEKMNILYARCNPNTDPGYDIKQTAFGEEMVEALKRYRQAWSLLDTLPAHRWGDALYGYMKEIITEDLMEKIQLEARAYVDGLMRLELKTFNKAQKAMYKRMEWPWPPRRARPRPKKPPKPPKPFIVDDALFKKVQPIFDMGLVTRPTTKIHEIQGDYLVSAYESNVKDPTPKFWMPCYGDIRTRLMMSCVLASGLMETNNRNKSVLLLGIPRNGKSFMVDAVAGEMNAIKIDISPNVFSAKTKAPGRLLTSVFQTARALQPAVIFCKNIERVFYKKVPPAETKERARAMKKPLQKLLKALPKETSVIFIATCSDPYVAKAAPMMKMFSEVLFVPWPDYGSLQQFFYTSFVKMISMPRDYCTQPLAQCFRGLGFGAVRDVFNKVLTPERICRLNIDKLDDSEFIEYMIENNIEQMDQWDLNQFFQFFLKYSHLKKEREQYDHINRQRKEAYEALDKKKADQEKKAAGK